MKYIYHTDAGHGWLQVKRKELRELRIESDISEFSYQYLDNVYLEEDVDAGTFLKAMKEQGKPFEIVEKNDGDRSQIRNFAHYR